MFMHALRYYFPDYMKWYTMYLIFDFLNDILKINIFLFYKHLNLSMPFPQYRGTTPLRHDGT